MTKKIGKVSATEKNPTTTDKFVFWLDDGIKVQPFDIVKIENNIAKGKSITYGVIQEIFHITDSTSHLGNFVSSDFGDVDSESLTKKLSLSYAEGNVIYNDKENYMPVQDGSAVYLADSDDIKVALGLDEIKNPIPCGLLKTSSGAVVRVNYNSDFLIGPEGAHLNISGISGLATKTSYAMFLLKAIQQTCSDVAIIILNVKGDDLLRLDEPNTKATEPQKEDWKLSGLDFTPFSGVKYYYPYKNSRSFPYSRTSLDHETLEYQYKSQNAFNFVYTYQHDRDKLEMLFSNIEDPNFTIDSILNYIMENEDFDDDYLVWETFYEKLKEYTDPEKKKAKANKDIVVQSWRKFRRLIGNSLRDDIFQSAKSNSQEQNTVFLSDSILNIKSGDTFVVDIAKLDEQLQFLVFGDIIKSVYDLKHGNSDRPISEIPKKIIIFVDELNKYAPDTTAKNSPILRLLLEITERGRSEGVILFSAEQFKSAVHDRVKGNCSTHVYGRTNAIEISKPDYRYIPKVFANMMTKLGKGDLILQHPIFATPLKVSFPYPSYKQGAE